MKNINNYKIIAMEVAKEAGTVLKKYFDQGFIVEAKAVNDVVTIADFESEKIILDKLKKHFPDHSIFAEESGDHNPNAEYKWIVDPLDGTRNFAAGCPFFAVSIALSYKNETILGVVYNPMVDELYFAQNGEGAFLNDKKIKVSDKTNLNDAILEIATIFTDFDGGKGLSAIQKLANKTRVIVNYLAPSISLCAVARGRLDGVLDFGTTQEDHAAGALIVQEAGGKVSTPNSSGWDYMKTGVIASNPILSSEINKELTVYAN